LNGRGAETIKSPMLRKKGRIEHKEGGNFYFNKKPPRRNDPSHMENVGKDIASAVVGRKKGGLTSGAIGEIV